MIQVVVDELCTKTVARIPIINPATGFVSSLFEANASPAASPPRSLNALPRKLREHTNMYSRKAKTRILNINHKACLILVLGLRSEIKKIVHHLTVKITHNLM